MIHTWQKRASSSVQEGGWLKTYRATTWTNTATVSTAKRITIVVSTDRRIGRRIRSGPPVDNDLCADLDGTDVVLEVHPFVMPASLREVSGEGANAHRSDIAEELRDSRVAGRV